MINSKILEIKVTDKLDLAIIKQLLREFDYKLDAKYVLAFTSQIIYNSVKNKAYSIEYNKLKKLYGSSKLTKIRGFLLKAGIIKTSDYGYYLTEKFKSKKYKIIKLDYTTKFQNKFYHIQNTGELPGQEGCDVQKAVDEEVEPQVEVKPTVVKPKDTEYVTRVEFESVLTTVCQQHNDTVHMLSEQIKLIQSQADSLKEITLLMKMEMENGVASEVQREDIYQEPIERDEATLDLLSKINVSDNSDFKRRMDNAKVPNDKFELPSILAATITTDDEDDEPIDYDSILIGKPPDIKRKVIQHTNVVSPIKDEVATTTATKPATKKKNKIKLTHYLTSKEKLMATNYIPIANEDALIEYIKSRKGQNLPYSEFKTFKKTTLLKFEEYEDTLLKASEYGCEMDDDLIEACCDALLLSKKRRTQRRFDTAALAVKHDSNEIMYIEEVEEVAVKVSPLEENEKDYDDLSEDELDEMVAAMFQYYKQVFRGYAKITNDIENQYRDVLSEFSLLEVRKIFQYLKRSWRNEYIENITPMTFSLENMITYSQATKDVVVSTDNIEAKHARFYNDQIRFLYEAMGNMKPVDEKQRAYIQLVNKIGRLPAALKKTPFDYASYERFLNNIGGIRGQYENAVTAVLSRGKLSYVKDFLYSIIKEHKKLTNNG